MANPLLLRTQGPFHADQLRSGSNYELSNGHPIQCSPTGRRGGRAASVGDGVLASDPAVQDVGIDVGFTPSPETLRAPDLAVGEIPDEPGWAQGVGEAHGLRKAVLEVLTARGFAADDTLRAALSRSDDLERLGSALRQAATASGLAEILAALQG